MTIEPITNEALAAIKDRIAAANADWRAKIPVRTLDLQAMIARIEAAEAMHNTKLAEAFDGFTAARARLEARAEAAEARVKRLEEALGDCAEWFKGYGDSHTAKGDIDKAQRNYDRERRARAALEGE